MNNLEKTISIRLNEEELKRIEDIKNSSLYNDKSRKPTNSEIIRDCISSTWMTLKELKINKKTW